jgi:hypothetical protein
MSVNVVEMFIWYATMTKTTFSSKLRAKAISDIFKKDNLARIEKLAKKGLVHERMFQSYPILGTFRLQFQL